VNASSGKGRPSATRRPQLVGPMRVAPVLLRESALSLHPPLHRLRFSLRLVPSALAVLPAHPSRRELLQLILSLLVSECAAHAGGSGSEASIQPEQVEYVHLRQAEEAGPRAAGKKLFNPFSSNEGAANALANMGSEGGAGPQQVWHATVVIRFASEAAAEYIAAKLHQLDTNKEGYSVHVECLLLSCSPLSASELRARWEADFFPTLVDRSAHARALAAGASGMPPSFQITLAFNGQPAGQRPDTLVLKNIPVAWVDGSLLTRAGRKKQRQSLRRVGPPPPPPGSSARGGAGAAHVPPVRFFGSMEEDDVERLSASEPSGDELDDGDDEEEARARKAGAPSWRRKLLIVKRQLELLLQPAAQLAKLPAARVEVRRWEYRPLPDQRLELLRRQRAEAAAGVRPAQAASLTLTEDMLRFPLLNPYPNHLDALHGKDDAPADSDEQKRSGPAGAAAAPAAPPLPMVPLCDVFVMVADYPTLLACFDFLHAKRMQNRLDSVGGGGTDDDDEDEEEEEEGLPSLSRGRVLDFGLDVDRSGYLRFDAVETRRLELIDASERAKAAAQLAAQHARKRKEEELRREREREVRRQEEEAERIEAEARAAREAQLFAEHQERERARIEAEQRAKEEARAQREALESVERMRKQEEKARQAARRREQRAQEAAERAAAAAATAPTPQPLQMEVVGGASGSFASHDPSIDAEEAALLAAEEKAEQERLERRKQLEAIRRRREAEEEAARRQATGGGAAASAGAAGGRAAARGGAAAVIDLDDPEWDQPAPGAFTASNTQLLEQWLALHADSTSTPLENTLVQLARAARLSLAQVKDWLSPRRPEWRLNATAAPIIKARSSAAKASPPPSAAAAGGGGDDDEMPGLLSAKDEASAEAARRRDAEKEKDKAFSMTLKGRPRVQTDEEAGADGFVRVENAVAAGAGERADGGAEQQHGGGAANASAAPLPESHPLSHAQQEMDRERGGGNKRHSTAFSPGQRPMSTPAGGPSGAFSLPPDRRAAMEKAAQAVAALAARLNNAASSSPIPAPSPAPATSLPPISEDAPMGAAAGEELSGGAEGSSSKKRSRSRSGSAAGGGGSRSRSRSRSPNGGSEKKRSKKRHRSSSRSRKSSRRSKRDRSPKPGDMPMLPFPFPFPGMPFFPGMPGMPFPFPPGFPGMPPPPPPGSAAAVAAMPPGMMGPASSPSSSGGALMPGGPDDMAAAQAQAGSSSSSARKERKQREREERAAAQQMQQQQQQLDTHDWGDRAERGDRADRAERSDRGDRERDRERNLHAEYGATAGAGVGDMQVDAAGSQSASSSRHTPHVVLPAHAGHALYAAHDPYGQMPMRGAYGAPAGFERDAPREGRGRSRERERGERGEHNQRREMERAGGYPPQGYDPRMMMPDARTMPQQQQQPQSQHDVRLPGGFHPERAAQAAAAAAAASRRGGGGGGGDEREMRGGGGGGYDSRHNPFPPLPMAPRSLILEQEAAAAAAAAAAQQQQQRRRRSGGGRGHRERNNANGLAPPLDESTRWRGGDDMM